MFTRTRASEGVKTVLNYPDGSPSEHWIKIRSLRSDEFIDKSIELNREGVDNEKLDKNLYLAVTLIADWSFEEECIEENKCTLLSEAPEIISVITKVSTDHATFFKQPSSN